MWRKNSTFGKSYHTSRSSLTSKTTSNQIWRVKKINSNGKFFREKDQANASLKEWYRVIQTEKNFHPKTKSVKTFEKFQNESRADQSFQRHKNFHFLRSENPKRRKNIHFVINQSINQSINRRDEKCKGKERNPFVERTYTVKISLLFPKQARLLRSAKRGTTQKKPGEFVLQRAKWKLTGDLRRPSGVCALSKTVVVALLDDDAVFGRSVQWRFFPTAFFTPTPAGQQSIPYSFESVNQGPAEWRMSKMELG